MTSSLGLLNSGLSISSMKIIGVDTSSGSSTLQMSGVVGLAPGDPDADLFLEKLKSEGRITQKIFAVDYRLTGETSTITFGGSVDGVGLNPIEYTDIIQFGSAYTSWAIAASNFNYGSKALSTDGYIQVVVDTGAGVTSLPYEHFQTFWTDVNTGRDCELDGWTYQCACTGIEDFDVFEIVLQDITLKMSPEAYVHEFVKRGGEQWCYFTITGAAQSGALIKEAILGDSFFRANYAIFDAESHRIGFSNKIIADPNSSSSGSGSTSSGSTSSGTSGNSTTVEPVKSSSDDSNGAFVFYLVTGVLGFLTVTVSLIVLGGIISQILVNHVTSIPAARAADSGLSIQIVKHKRNGSQLMLTRQTTNCGEITGTHRSMRRSIQFNGGFGEHIRDANMGSGRFSVSNGSENISP